MNGAVGGFGSETGLTGVSGWIYRSVAWIAPTAEHLCPNSVPKPRKGPLPPSLRAEQALVDASKQLITRFEAKIKTTIDRVLGGGE